MTTHLTEFDLTESLLGLGLTRTDMSEGELIFASSDQGVVDRAHAFLLDNGFGFGGSDNTLPGEYVIWFADDDGKNMRVVEVRYVHTRRTSMYFAICYVDHGRLIQYLRPYRSFVTDLHGDEAIQMERDFMNDMTGATAGTRFYWVPILVGWTLAHF